METRKKHGVYETPLAESISVMNEGTVLIGSTEGYGEEIDINLEVPAPQIDAPVL